MICLKNTKLSAEVLFGKMLLKYIFTSSTIYWETSVIKNCHVHELLSRQYSFLFTDNISTSSAILNSRTLSPKLGHERKFEQRLARGLFWSRLSNLITIPDCSVLSSVYNVRKQLLDRFCLLLGVSRCSSGIYSRSFISFIPMIYLTSFVTVLASYSQMIRPYTALQN